MRVRVILLTCLLGCELTTAAVSASFTPIDSSAIDVSERSAFTHAEAQTRAAQLRQEWLQSGHTLPASTTVPSIRSGSILTPTIDVTKPPSAPSVQLKFTVGSSGLNFIHLDFYSATTQQIVTLIYQPNYFGPIEKSGTLVIQSPVSNTFYGNNNSSRGPALGTYAAPGTWYLGYGFIEDNAGNSMYYNTDQLASIFGGGTFTVVNQASADTAIPTVTAGKVLTRNVSLSSPRPAFGASLTATDDLSGLSSGLIYVEGPNNVSNFSVAFRPSPTLSGTINVYVPFYSNSSTGKWTITGYQACDVAGNCAQDYNSQDIKALFGNDTFNVTQ